MGGNWKEIGDLFAEALDLAPALRAEFLDRRCAHDPDLKREVLRLLALDEHPDDFLDCSPHRLLTGPSAHEPLFNPGDLVAERFRVVRLLGMGGMGEVYEAADALLGERVALKTVRSSAETALQLDARLRREVQLARRVTHPSVCRVHDVARHSLEDGREAVLLTMELVDGETLAARLLRGPLPAAEALRVAAQLAEALDAAHAQGVLHRDVKPANVLLASEDGTVPRAVLTDFGIARASEEAGTSALTRAGAVIGTPGYMAPELLRGEPATPKADLYAFALIVCEMLSGVRTSVGSFEPKAFEARVAAINSADTSRGRAWARALTTALDPDPERRFPTAGALVAALESEAIRPRTRWHKPLAVAAVALVVALSAVAFRYYGQGSPGLAPASRVLLAPTTNGTAEPDLDGAGEILRSQLAQSAHFELISEERVEAVLQLMKRGSDTALEPPIAREVAMREAAALVVYSSVSRIGPEYVLGVRLERVGPRPTLIRGSWTRTFSAARREAFVDSFREAAVWIRQIVGERAADLVDQDRPPADTTTSSWEALRLFTNANRRASQGQLAEAAVLFGESVRIDPGFAMGHMRLGDVLISLKRDREGYAAWRRAIALLDERQLTSRESLRIRSQYFEDMGDLPAAEKALRSYVLHYPNDYHAVFFLGSVLHDLGRTEEAVPRLAKAVALRPDSLVPATHLATAYLELGRFDAAQEQIDRLARLQHDDWATWLTALRQFGGGNTKAALATLDPLARSQDVQWRSRAFTLRASWLAELRQFGAAALELERGIAFDTESGFRERLVDKWLHLADVRRQMGDVSGSVAAAQRAVATNDNARQLMLAGILLVRAGRMTEAADIAKRLAAERELPKAELARLRLAGEIALASNRSAEAVAALEKADAMGPRRESRLPFAQALVRAGLSDRARHVLQALLDHPTLPYSAPEPELPGLSTAARLEWAQLNGSRRQTR